MAIHGDTVSLLKESLPEFLHVARYCIKSRKGSGGCFGFPGAALMLSIADSIGSYHRGRKNFTVPVDGKNRLINGDGFKHFFIFNSGFYQLALSEKMIKKIYGNYRNFLLHNSALAENHFLYLGNSDDAPFVESDSNVHIYVAGLLRVTDAAVQKFIKEIHSIVPGSEQEKDLGRKRS